MKTIILLGLITCLFSTVAGAQTTDVVEDFKPSSLNQPGKEYPRSRTHDYCLTQ